MVIDKDEIIRLTEEYGGSWGINHTRRLLSLVSVIGEGQEYNEQAIWLAAHLHDWGAYPAFMQKGVDHALRSRQVAGKFLEERGFDPEFSSLVLECIEFHHVADTSNSIEALLLSDADRLDFLGPVGVARDFSKNPKDLRLAYDTIRRRRETIPAQLCLEKSQEVAQERLHRMDLILAWFEEDSFEHF
jgi:uncharacterized protein